MSRELAVVENDEITNVIIGDPALFPAYLDVTDMDPKPGMHWVRVDGVWQRGTPTPPVELPVRKRWITEREFRTKRLNGGEMDRINLAIFRGMHPNATEQQIELASKLQGMKDLLAAGHNSVVDLDNEELVNGLTALAAVPGLLDASPKDPQYASRVEEILTAPITTYHPDA